MSNEQPTTIFDAEAKSFLRSTGVRVILIEVAVVLAILGFQFWFGR